MVAFAERGNADVEAVLLTLRRSLEADRFGFLAHVLAIRDGCTSQNCRALALLKDSSRVRSNLSAETLDHYLEHYQEVWAKTLDGSPEIAQLTGGSGPSNAAGPRRMVNIDFPSAASIPPVSIMNPEPTGPVLPGVAAAAATNPNPKQNAAAPPSRHTRKQVAPSPVQTPVQPAAAGSASTEPRTAAAPVGAPVQLSPPASSASAAATARAQ
jgi:hypothetical protein